MDTEVDQAVLEETQVLQAALEEELEVQAVTEDKVLEVKQEELVDLVVLVVQAVLVEATETRKEQSTKRNARNSYNLQNMFLALMIHCRDSVSVLRGDSPTSSSFEILGDIYFLLYKSLLHICARCSSE